MSAHTILGTALRVGLVVAGMTLFLALVAIAHCLGEGGPDPAALRAAELRLDEALRYFGNPVSRGEVLHG